MSIYNKDVRCIGFCGISLAAPLVFQHPSFYCGALHTSIVVTLSIFMAVLSSYTIQYLFLYLLLESAVLCITARHQFGADKKGWDVERIDRTARSYLWLLGWLRFMWKWSMEIMEGFQQYSWQAEPCRAVMCPYCLSHFSPRLFICQTQSSLAALYNPFKTLLNCYAST